MIPLMKSAFLHEAETRRALAEFIASAPKLSMDTKCREFERAFAAVQGREDAVLFNSGGSANLAMLQALKNLGRLKDGDAVGFSGLTWATNVMPIIQLGMEPIAVDCDPKTLNVMSHNLEERARTVDIKALFITNALGFAGDLDRIRDICAGRSILLIEDNCEAFGTELPAGRTGNFGVCASFSFFVAHHMSTIEGGMASTDDEELGEMLRMVRANGWDRNLTPAQQQKWRKQFGISGDFQAKYAFYELGYNFRPTEITGFIGLYQLKFAAENFRERERNYFILESAAKRNPDLISPARSHISLLSSFAFPVLCRDRATRDEYIERFTDAGIEVRPMIAGNIQRQPFYRKYAKRIFELPGTDSIDQRGFYCGNYPELTHADLETIAGCLSSRSR
jgi:CDP-6-deoxy-D-xylo-4-hexulose-3-dehydrase